MTERRQMNIDDISKKVNSSELGKKFTKSFFSKRIRLPLFFKKTLAFFSTLLLLFFFYWFLSVQYPLEVESYQKRILGFGYSIFLSVQNKSYISSSFFNFGSGSISTGSVDSFVLTPDPFQDVPTPLAQSLKEGSLKQFVEEIKIPVLEEDTVSDISLDKRLDIKEEFILLKEKADLFLVNTSDTGSSLQLSIAKLASSKIDVLLSDSSLDLSSLEEELDHIRTLLRKLDT